jgi:two-component system, NtrC family, nitrogen regulation response regulator GlnG
MAEYSSSSGQQTVIVADDDLSIRTVLTHALGRQGFRVRATGTASTLWRWVSEGEGDAVVTDVVMPDENIFDMLPRIRAERPELPIIVISAQSTLDTAMTATAQGAYEYLPKPFDLNELVGTVKKALSAAKHQRERAGFLNPDEPQSRIPLIGRSSAMQEIYRVLARLTKTDLTVMISGESGTGKELVARALHDYGKRRDGPFVAVNMAAIPRELIESELFGHERGAFTGAQARAVGRFEQAQGGTLFLDEIGDMPLEAQTRLLRVLQEGEYSTVGGRTQIKTDVRIIAATNKDLRNLIAQGLFREDLFFRLNVVPLRIPPLRERAEDISDLVRHFLTQAARDGLAQKSVDQSGIEALKRHSWPGNVRELENLMRRLAALCPEDVLDSRIVMAELAEPKMRATAIAQEEAESLAAAVARQVDRLFSRHGEGLPPPGLYERVLREVERPLILKCLTATRGNQIKASTLLGLNRNTLRKKIRDLDIDVVRGTTSAK